MMEAFGLAIKNRFTKLNRTVELDWIYKGRRLKLKICARLDGQFDLDFNLDKDLLTDNDTLKLRDLKSD